MIIPGENVTAILLTPHCNTADNGADVVVVVIVVAVVVVVVVVGLQSVRREANVEGRGWGRAEAIINNWELIKVPDKSMEPVAPVPSSPRLARTPSAASTVSRARRARVTI